MFKKTITAVVAGAILLSGGLVQSTTTVLAAEQAKTEIRVAKETTIDLKDENFGLSDDILEAIRNNELSDQEENVLKEAEIVNPSAGKQTRSLTVGAVIGIIAGCIAIGKAGHSLGKYAGRQAQVRLGLTPAKYKANRWAFRAGITASFGALVALGFDDYFYGI